MIALHDKSTMHDREAVPNWKSFEGRTIRLGSSKYAVVNEWVFVSDSDAPDELICSRSSGASDYHAEWWRLPTDKFALYYVAYHQLDHEIDQGTCFTRDNGGIAAEANTFADVIWYCATHLHPDLPT